MTRSTPYDAPRRLSAERLLLRGGLLLLAAVLIGSLAGWTRRARAAGEGRLPDLSVVARHPVTLQEELEGVRGEMALVRLQLERANAILANSAKYQIPADLSAAIYDIALSEGIEPSLGYQLVKIESSFRAGARSSMDAIGYTQLRLATARHYQPDLTERDLRDRETNLRIGFRFLSDLLARYDGDMHLALLAYNRGPARVQEILEAGGDPRNGYSDAVLDGYRPLTLSTPAR